MGAAVWTSEDGISWSKAIVESESGGMYDVTASGPGLVATGEVPTEDWSIEEERRAPFAGAIWTSVDGMNWKGVPHDEITSPREQMKDVVAGGPGLVTVGADGIRAAAWTSPDGLTRTQVPPSRFTGSEGPIVSVISVGTQLVAFGGAQVWTSSDGITWTQTENLGAGEIDEVGIHAVAATEDGLIAVGQVGESVAVWVATEG